MFSINNGIFLTDFQSPYSFSLPTQKWQDGSYSIYPVVYMRDGYTTANAPSDQFNFR